MSNPSLPPDFWHDFHASHWEKRPAVFKDLLESPFLSPERLFDAIVGMPTRTESDRFWATRQATPCTRNDFQVVPLDQHGPRPGDQSLDGFFARVRQQIGDAQVGLNLHKLERAQPELWFSFRKFVHELNAIAGELPSGRWDIDTFLGTYKTTPLGIHQDNASVFAIGVMGHRTYYTWPDEYFRPGDPALSRLDTASLQAHLDKAVRMELGPGDLVYWPSSNWHFVTSDGQPSAVISVSAYFGRNLSEILGNQVKRLVANQLGDSDFNRKYTLRDEAVETPRQMTEALELLEETVRNGTITNALQRLWLTFCSADGLHPIIPDEQARLGLQDEIFVDPGFPVLWNETPDGALLIAANGLSFPVPPANNPVIIDMLEQLNTGQPVVAREMAVKYGRDEVPADMIINILNMLNRCRAYATRQD